MTDDGGQTNPTKEQAQTEREVGPKSCRGTGSGDRCKNRVMSPRRTRWKPIAGISHILLPFLVHSGGCASLVGADVVKNSGHV